MFKKYAIEGKKLTNKRKGLVKRRETWKADMQTFLMGAANMVANHGNADQITCIIKELSVMNQDGSVLLDSDAKQIGKYCMAFLPIRWTVVENEGKKTSSFKLKPDHNEFDYDKAQKSMEGCRWDMYGREKAENAFDEEKKFKMIISTAKQIVDKTDADNVYNRKAQTILRAFPDAA